MDTIPHDMAVGDDPLILDEIDGVYALVPQSFPERREQDGEFCTLHGAYARQITTDPRTLAPVYICPGAENKNGHLEGAHDFKGRPPFGLSENATDRYHP